MASTYEPIASATATSVTNFTFDSNGAFSNYTDLIVIVHGKCYYAAVNQAYLRFNGDIGSNYSDTKLVGNGTTASSNRSTNYSYIFAGDFAQPSQTESSARFQIMQVNNASIYKTVLIESANPYNLVERGVGLWRSTSAITSILVGNNYGFEVGTTASLYGIKAA